MNKVHYRTSGVLTGTIEQENVGAAQEYLTSDDMTKYLDESIEDAIFHIQWALHSDGHNYHVDAYATRTLTQDEQRVLSEWVSGQNSDGLGEGFEQQDFAETKYEEQDVDCCNDEDCDLCGGAGWYSCDEQSHMISFDWQTNELPWTRVP